MVTAYFDWDSAEDAITGFKVNEPNRCINTICKPDRSEYNRQYYLQKRKKSVRKKPVMTEDERRIAHNIQSKNHRHKTQQQ